MTCAHVFRSVLCLLVLIAVCVPACAQEPIPHEQMFLKAVYRDGHGHKLPYRVLLPAHYSRNRRYPLMVYFHGIMERGIDNTKPLKYIAPVVTDPNFRWRYPCIVLVPQCPDGERWIKADYRITGYLSTQSPMPATRMTVAVINRLSREYGVDRNRIYLTGISFGGSAVWDLLMRYPDKFAAGVPISAQTDPTIAPRIAHTPVWVFQGEKDSYIKVEKVRVMVRALRKSGGTPKYTEYPAAEHFIWDRVFAEPELFPWLFNRTLANRS